MGTYQINCSHMEGKLHLASVVVEQDRSIKRPRSVLSGDLYQSREHQRKDLVRNNVQGASKAFRRTPGLQTPSRLHDAVGLQRYAPRGVAVAPSCRAPPPMKSRVAPCPCCPRPCRVRCWPTYHAVCSAYRAAPPCAMAELLLDGALPLNRSNAKPNKKRWFKRGGGAMAGSTSSPETTNTEHGKVNVNAIGNGDGNVSGK